MAGDAIWRVRATNGCLVGLPAIVGNEPYSMTATVVRDSQICKISRADFHQLTQQNPRLCFRHEATLGVSGTQSRAREAVDRRDSRPDAF